MKNTLWAVLRNQTLDMESPSTSQKHASLRYYRVSKLVKAADVKEHLPLIKIRSKAENIIIPSVQKSMDLSPRSLDSRSLEDGSIISAISSVSVFISIHNFDFSNLHYIIATAKYWTEQPWSQSK